MDIKGSSSTTRMVELVRRECRISRALARLSANTSGNADFLMSRKPVGPSILSMTQQNADRREEPSTVSSRAGAEQPFFNIRLKIRCHQKTSCKLILF